MSEYIEIETEMSDDGSTMYLYSNLTLSDQGRETYHSMEAMEEGSPLAQALAVVNGIAWLRIEGSEMIIARRPEAEWYTIMADVSAALKDFFL